MGAVGVVMASVCLLCAIGGVRFRSTTGVVARAAVATVVPATIMLGAMVWMAGLGFGSSHPVVWLALLVIGAVLTNVMGRMGRFGLVDRSGTVAGRLNSQRRVSLLLMVLLLVLHATSTTTSDMSSVHSSGHAVAGGDSTSWLSVSALVALTLIAVVAGYCLREGYLAPAETVADPEVVARVGDSGSEKRPHHVRLFRVESVANAGMAVAMSSMFLA